MCQGFNYLSGFLHHFVLGKLAISSIRVKTSLQSVTFHNAIQSAIFCVLLAGLTGLSDLLRVHNFGTVLMYEIDLPSEHLRKGKTTLSRHLDYRRPVQIISSRVDCR